MIYTKREKLTCYNMQDELNDVRFSELKVLLMKRPANIIYCVKGGKLYGIISMGDIYRADKVGNDYVSVNKQFTSVRVDEFIFAKQIFKDNSIINELPVVNSMNELVGEYSRWDDLITTSIFEQLKSNKYVIDFMRDKKLALVRPCKDFVKKHKLMQIWNMNLIESGAMVSIINREDIMNIFDRVDYLLFTDEEEKRGTQTLYKNILGIEYNCIKAKTYNEMGKEIENEIDTKIHNELGDKIVSKVLKVVMESGVYVLTLNQSNRDSKYCQRLQNDILDKFSKIGKKPTSILYEEFQRDFFAELYNEEYAKKILSHSYAKRCIDGVNSLKDADEETYKVIDGERRTLSQPIDFERCIYFYGPCIVVGAYNADEHTIESYLQAKLNSKGYKVKCLNYGFWGNQLEQLNRMLSTPFNKGDIVVFYNSYGICEDISNIDLMEICEKYQIPATWVVDDILHCNHKLNSIYADEIFENIWPIVKEGVGKKELVEVKDNFIIQGYIEKYFYGFTEAHRGVNGAIVMNCNPFTLGHRYLIERALNYVDHLIIFVVEENRSLFTFKERFAMVMEGTKDLENVTVVPSGNFILSQNTFPEYFLKVEDDDIVHNVEYDITLFAEQIAPELNISYRFVGEEPDDSVTNKYNEAMKNILPKYGINIVEISRAKVDGKIISASLVRKKLLNKDCTDLVKFIPHTTKMFLELNWE